MTAKGWSSWKAELASSVNWRVISMLGILAALWVFFRIQVGEVYFSGESISKLSRDMAPWTILAAGMTLVIVTGNIDLSVGSLLALVGASCAFVIDTEYGLGMPPSIGVLVGLAVGLGLGALQGYLTAYLRIPSFIVTLGGLFVFRGLTQHVSQNDPRLSPHSWIASFGIDYLPPVAGIVAAVIVCLVMMVLLVRNRIHDERMGLPVQPVWLHGAEVFVVALAIVGITVTMNAYHGVPVQTVIMIAVLAVLSLVMRASAFGRHLYAIGGNPEAARLAGIDVKRKLFLAFVVMGLCAGIAGIVLVAQNQGATKNAGTYYELYAIAAAVIGGTSLMGGRGTIFGTFLGGLVMATLIQGMDYSSLENWIQLVVRGAVLVLAVGIDPSTRSAIGRLRSG